MVSKKGAADVMLLIGLAIGMVLIFFDFTPFWSEGDTYRVVLHTHMFGASNALDAAGLYVDTALDYSVYQGVYDGLNSLDTDSLPTNEEIRETIRKNIEQNLAKYTGELYRFTVDYDVNLPVYKVSLQEQSGGFKIKTTSDNANMSITKYVQEYGMKEDITIKRTKLPQGNYDIDYSGLVNIAREKQSALSSSFQSDFSEASKSLDDLIAAGSVTCTSVQTCSDELTKEFKNRLSGDAMTSTESGSFLITTELLGATVTVSLMESGKVKTYKAEASQKVMIKQKESARKYPVWDGSRITFDSLKLAFQNKASKTTTL